MSSKTPLKLASAGCLLLAAALVFAACSNADSSPADDGSALLERGRYLVHNVGMCVDCHSPRGPDGQFVEAKHLTGSPLAFVATVPMPWAQLAPRIAGLPAGYDRAAMTRFLMTGERPAGLPPTMPPMPAVRLSQIDAEAVTAYLASLSPEA